MSNKRKRARYGRDAPLTRGEAVETKAAGAVFTLADPETWNILCAAKAERVGSFLTASVA